jgi:hypothetical protein
VADDRIQRPNIPYTPDRYDAQNEAAFRREVATMVHEVDAALLRFADTVSSGLITHATSHAPGGSDTLDSYYSQVGHSHLVSALTDVTITGIASGEILKWNGSAWINNTLAEAGIAAASHTHVESDITDLQAYLLDITGESVGSLSDVTVTAGTDGDVLQAAAGVWVDRSLAEAGISAVGHSHVHTDVSDFDAEVNTLADARIAAAVLNDLSNVTITGIASGEILKWSGAAWINNTLAEAGISATGHTHLEADITDLQSYLLNISGESLGDLSNVTDASSAAGWYLRSTAAGTWVAQSGLSAADVTAHEAALTITESQISDLNHATASLADVGDVTITTIASGELLQWNGSAWINQTIAELGLLNTASVPTLTGKWTFDPAQGIEIGTALDFYLSGATMVMDATGFLTINIDSDNNGSTDSFSVAHNATGTGGTKLFEVKESGLVQIGIGGTTGYLKVHSNRADSDSPHLWLQHDQAVADEIWISAWYNNGTTKQGDIGWNAAGDAYFRNHEDGGDMVLVTGDAVTDGNIFLQLAGASGLFRMYSGSATKGSGNQLLEVGENQSYFDNDSLFIRNRHATNNVLATLQNYGASVAPKVRLQRSLGTYTTPTAITSGLYMGEIQFGAYGTSWDHDGAVIRAVANQTWTASAHGTYLDFLTTVDGAISPTRRMRIADDGLIFFGAAVGTGLNFDDIGTNDWEIKAPAGKLYLQALGSTTPTGDGVYVDDGGTNKAKVAGIKNITTSATAPTGDYPYGTLHLIY